MWVCTSFDPLSNQCVYSIFMACHLLAPSCRPSSSFLKQHSTSSEAGNMKKSLWVKGCGKKVGGSTTAWIFFAEFSGLQSQHLFRPLGRNYVAWDASTLLSPTFIFRLFLILPSLFPPFVWAPVLPGFCAFHLRLGDCVFYANHKIFVAFTWQTGGIKRVFLLEPFKPALSEIKSKKLLSSL